MNTEETQSKEQEVAKESKLVFTSDEHSFWITEVFEGEKKHVTWNRNSAPLSVEVNELSLTRFVDDPLENEWWDEIKDGYVLLGSGSISLGSHKSRISLLGSKVEVSQISVRITEAKEDKSGFEDGWNNYSLLGNGQFDGDFWIEPRLEKSLFNELVQSVKAQEIEKLTLFVNLDYVRGFFSNEDDIAFDEDRQEIIERLKYLWDQDVEGLEKGSDLEKKARAMGATSNDPCRHLRTEIRWDYKNRFKTKSKDKLEADDELNWEAQQELEEQKRRVCIEEEIEKRRPHLEMMKVMRSISTALWLILIALIISFFI